MAIEAHGPVPALTLRAAGSGREVALQRCDVPLVLILPTQDTADAVEGIRTAIRVRYPDPSRVLVCSVVNVSGVPRLMRKVAEGALNNRYREASGRLAEGLDPRDFIVILQDWKGDVAGWLGAKEAKRLTVAVLAPNGRFVGAAQADDPAAAAIQFLEQAGA